MRRGTGAAVLAAAAFLAGVHPAAMASGWSDTASAAASYSSGLLAPPTAPAAIPGTCDILTGDTVLVSWTPSSSTWADGYEVARSTAAGGPFSVVGTVVGGLTVTYLDTSVNFSTTYYYVVRATKFAWRSTDTSAVSRTTKSSLCL